MAQTKTTTGKITKMLKSWKWACIGVLMFFVGVALLGWVENRIIMTKDVVEEAHAFVKDAKDVSTINPSLDGKLIYASAQTESKELLRDDIFGVWSRSLKLLRTVSYYQWTEKISNTSKDTFGRHKEKKSDYTYSQEWVAKPVKSESFANAEYQHLNYALAQLQSKEWIAKKVSFGAYELPDFMKQEMSDYVTAPVRMTADQSEQWEDAIRKSVEAVRVVNPDVKIMDMDNEKMVHIKGNMVYFGYTPDTPHIGDVKVVFEQVLPAEISIIAKVNGNTFVPYESRNGNQYYQLRMGKIGENAMFQSTQKSNDTLKWILRVSSILLIIIGLRLIFCALVEKARNYAFLSSLMKHKAGFISIILGLACAFLIVAAIWHTYSPMISIAAFVLAALCLTFLLMSIKKQKLLLS